jgi:inhibitor of KinA
MTNDFSTYKIQLCSSNSLLIEWQLENLDQDFVRYQQAFIKLLKGSSKDLCYLTPSFDTILVKYNDTIQDIKDKKDEINQLLSQYLSYTAESYNFKIFEIPVCYESFGIDLEDVSKHAGLSITDIIKIHTSKIYTLYFIGFLPGFLYLGNVDKRIQISRKQTPRAKVEQGSIGIAENQTGIYPKTSPGGWQIIGRTPLSMFNADINPPSPFKPGDQIKFKAIDRKKFDEIRNSKSNEIKIL